MSDLDCKFSQHAIGRFNTQQVGDIFGSVFGKFGGKFLQLVLGEGDAASGKTKSTNHGLGN